MTNAARILVVGDQDDRTNRLSTELTEFGYECVAGGLQQSVAEVTGKRRPDIVVLDMGCAEASKNPKSYFALARSLKQSALASHLRIVLMTGEDRADFSEAMSDIDDLLIGPASPSRLHNRLKSLVRLNTMHEELVRRLNTQSRYGVDAPPAVTPPRQLENAMVLVLGDAKGLPLIELALAKNATLVGALSAGTALDYLDRRDFDAIVIDAGSDLDRYLGFARDVRRNSRLFNLPIVALVNPIGDEILTEALDAGVTDYLYKPVAQEELRVRIVALVREERFRASLRHVYAEALHFATSDSLTGLYNRGFLYEHLSSVIADAERSSQTFSLAAFAIDNMDEINARYGFAIGDRVIRQVGQTIGLLTRGEDLAARFGGIRFAVILPDTPVDQATYAVDRIKGVIHHTDLALEPCDEPIHVRLRYYIKEYARGLSATDMLQQVWSAKPQRSIPATAREPVQMPTESRPTGQRTIIDAA